jgi:hypothetical protein
MIPTMDKVVKDDSHEVIMFEDKEVENELGTKEIEKIPEVDPETEAVNLTIKKKREDIRGRLAFMFLLGYFIILVGVIILAAFIDGARVETMMNSVITISGVLSGSLGFVIGYYFRRQEEE